MNLAQIDINRIVFGKYQDFAAIGDSLLVFDENAVFGQVVLRLQAKTYTGVDLNEFDFEAPVFVSAVVQAAKGGVACDSRV